VRTWPANGEPDYNVVADGGQQRPGLSPGPDRARRALRDLCCLQPPRRAADPAQVHIGDLRRAAGALLDPEQHLHHHQRASPDRRPAARGLGGGADG